MSFASMHNDYLDPDRHLWPEEQDPDQADAEMKAQRTGARILRLAGCATWGELYRAIYKGTACGAGVGVRFAHEGMLYCSDLYKRGPRDWPLEIHVSSIVEGVDQTTDTYVIDLTGRRSWRKLWRALDRVEREARAIWDETHGCDACQAHWVSEGCGDGTLDGLVPVWSDCPECGGNGVVI